jgi:hypothetical protein
MKRLRFLLIFILLLKVVSLSFGWGAVGHRLVAEVAKNSVGKNTQDSVEKYLGSMSWENAATWMDEIKSNSKYDYMKPWHYLDLDKGEQYDNSNAGGNNVVVQLQKAIDNLKNKSKLTKDEINFNLKVLFHLMGDFHQPLHVGYGVDKGGNTIKVTFKGKSTNLHHVWDSDIIEYQDITYKQILDILSKMSKEDIKKITKGTIIEWMTDTRKLLDFVYSFTNNDISSDYIVKASTVIENQLIYAGVRLGSELDDIFKN